MRGIFSITQDILSKIDKHKIETFTLSGLAPCVNTSLRRITDVVNVLLGCGILQRIKPRQYRVLGITGFHLFVEYLKNNEIQIIYNNKFILLQLTGFIMKLFLKQNKPLTPRKIKKLIPGQERRIYDVLGVLESANILKRNGKSYTRNY